MPPCDRATNIRDAVIGSSIVTCAGSPGYNYSVAQRLRATYTPMSSGVWSYKTITFTATDAHKHIVIHQDPNIYNGYSRTLLIDDIMLVEESAAPDITITSDVVEACVGGELIIDYTICSDEAFTASVEAILPQIPGLSFSVLGDLPGGTGSISIDPNIDPCVTLRLIVHVSDQTALPASGKIKLILGDIGCAAEEVDHETQIDLEERVPDLDISHSIVNSCIGGNVVVDYTICSDEAVQFSAAALLPVISGIAISHLSELTGQAAIYNIDPQVSNCITIRLVLDIDDVFTGGYQFDTDLVIGFPGRVLCPREDLVYTHTITFADTHHPPIPGFSYSIDCKVATFTSEAHSSGDTHFWDFGDGTSSTAINPVKTYTYKTGQYTVSHCVTNECGTRCDQQIVVLECLDDFVCPCEGSGALNIDATGGRSIQEPGLAYLLSSLPLIPEESYSYTNTCMAIEGRLEFDKADTRYYIVSGEIKMQPASSMAVLNASKLYFTNVNQSGGIHSCSQMWRGIDIANNAQLHFQGNVLTQDAQYAVNAGHGARLFIQNSTFQNNYVGIYTASSSQTQAIHTPIPLRGNHFTMTRNLLSPFSGQWPLPGTTGIAGILLNDATMSVGSETSSTAVNQFSNLLNGILAYRSGVGIYRTEIFDLVQITQNPVADIRDGQAIRLQDGILIGKLNTIDNVRMGIHTLQTAGIVLSGNEMTGLRVGIHAHETGTLAAQIEQNDIECDVLGISVYALQYKMRPEIRFNKVTLNYAYNPINPLACSAMRLRGLSSRPGYEGQINDNKVKLNAATSAVWALRGIELYNTDHLLLENNEITVSSLQTSIGGEGYSTRNSSRLRFYNNEFGADQPLFHYGFYTRASVKNAFCCNTVDNVYDGFAFLEDCDQSLFRNNEMSNYTVGLLFSNSKIGQQIHHVNQWGGVPQYQGYDASNDGNELLRYASQFEVDPGVSCSVPLWPTELTPVQACDDHPNNWFLNKSAMVSQACIPANQCILEAEETLQLGPNQVWSAEGRFSDGPYGDMMQWESRRRLYEHLLIDDGWAQDTAVIDSFWLATAGSSLARLSQTSLLLDAAKLPDSASFTTLQMLYDGYLSLSDDISRQDSLLATAATEVDSLDIYALKALLLDSLAGTLDALQETRRQADSLQLLQITTALASNNLVSPLHILDANEKTVHAVYLATAAQGILSLDSAEQAQILPIALQCPLEGGRTVHTARLLYMLDHPHVEFDDDSLCQPPLPRPAGDAGLALQHKEDRINAHPAIYPNPADASVTIHLPSSPFPGRPYLMIRDMAGRPVSYSELDATPRGQSISVRHLQPGIYLLSIDGLGEPYIEKLVIQR